MKAQTAIAAPEAEQIDEPPPSAPDGFQIHDAASANWLARFKRDHRVPIRSIGDIRLAGCSISICVIWPDRSPASYGIEMLWFTAWTFGFR